MAAPPRAPRPTSATEETPNMQTSDGVHVRDGSNVVQFVRPVPAGRSTRRTRGVGAAAAVADIEALHSQARRAPGTTASGRPLTHSHVPGGPEHSHEAMERPGSFVSRPRARRRADFASRAFTVGIGGPVGSGKTALTLQLCRLLRDRYQLCVVTNDIFTREDWEFLVRNDALPERRMVAVETGGCPHAAIREDYAANMEAIRQLTAEFGPDLVIVESGGDNLAANFSTELADYIIYCIDVAGGDKIPRKGGPGITESDLLVINKTDLAEAVGADMGVMTREAAVMRSGGPTLLTQAKHNIGIEEVARHVLDALHESRRVN